MSIIKGTNQVVAGFGGTKRCIGEVYFSQSSLATDNPGALPGWTGEYYENGKTLFPDLYNFVKAHSELQVTKAQYDSAIATYGECPKYVIDENGASTTVLVPGYVWNVTNTGATNFRVVTKTRNPVAGDPIWASTEEQLSATGVSGLFDFSLDGDGIVYSCANDTLIVQQAAPVFGEWDPAVSGDDATSVFSKEQASLGEIQVIVGTSLRLPKYANYIKMANSTEGIKNIEAGLPNITGKTGRFAGRYEDGTGALRTVDYGQSSGTRDEQYNSSRITFDASLSNPIYGKSSTVTPASTTLYPWVVAYTAAIPASTAQAAEFQQALTNTSVNKMDKVQFWTPDNFVQLRNYSMELDWANTYTGSASSTEPFGANLDDTNKELVMPADGLLFGTNYGGIVSVNGKQIFLSTTDPNLTNSCFPLEVRKGDVVFMRANVCTALVPFKYQSGANNLVLGINYYGKYATLEALDTTSASILNNGQGQGRWALVGDDTNGYTRYYTKPTNNTFSAFEWAAGGADTYLGQETDYVVESQVNTDGSWYRKYKSGWVEQGGQTPTVAGGATTTVTLLKPYNNAVYNVVVQPVGAYTGAGEANNVIPTRTTTNFIISCGQIAAQAFSWRAEGQGAN